jgi:hypothetical protein
MRRNKGEINKEKMKDIRRSEREIVSCKGRIGDKEKVKGKEKQGDQIKQNFQDDL